MSTNQPIKLIVNLVALAGVLCCAEPKLFAQGCVAVRQMSPCIPSGIDGLIPGLESIYLEQNHWQLSGAYRYLHSFRHFVGSVEQTQRETLGNQVINTIHSLDTGITYAITKRYDVNLTVPLVYAERSSLNKFDNTRHIVRASGLGDMRLVGDAWVFDPEKYVNGNIALGIGVKFPTGDDAASDTFLIGKNKYMERPVDQSIQPGDGGWGVVLELQGFQKIYKELFGYVAGAYLFNPQDVNGVKTFRSAPGETIQSIPDQYQGRLGLSYILWPKYGLSVSLGGRIEGVPVRDAIGESNGFRRPGFAISIEPGLALVYKRNIFSITTPVALYRDRQTSVADLQNGGKSGDAAFADYLITATIAHRF